MSEILDEIERKDSTPELSRNARHLQIVIGIILIITAGIVLWAGIQTVILQLHFQISIFLNLKLILVLVLIPITIIAGACMLIAKKRIGWMISLASCFFISSYALSISLSAPNISRWLGLLALFFGVISSALLLRRYRNYYKYKTKDVYYLIGIPLFLVLIMMYRS